MACLHSPSNFKGPFLALSGQLDVSQTIAIHSDTAQRMTSSTHVAAHFAQLFSDVWLPYQVELVQVQSINPPILLLKPKQQHNIAGYNWATLCTYISQNGKQFGWWAVISPMGIRWSAASYGFTDYIRMMLAPMPIFRPTPPAAMRIAGPPRPSSPPRQSYSRPERLEGDNSSALPTTLPGDVPIRPVLRLAGLLELPYASSSFDDDQSLPNMSLDGEVIQDLDGEPMCNASEVDNAPVSDRVRRIVACQKAAFRESTRLASSSLPRKPALVHKAPKIFNVMLEHRHGKAGNMQVLPGQSIGQVVVIYQHVFATWNELEDRRSSLLVYFQLDGQKESYIVNDYPIENDLRAALEDLMDSRPLPSCLAKSSNNISKKRLKKAAKDWNGLGKSKRANQTRLAMSTFTDGVKAAAPCQKRSMTRSRPKEPPVRDGLAISNIKLEADTKPKRLAHSKSKPAAASAKVATDHTAADSSSVKTEVNNESISIEQAMLQSSSPLPSPALVLVSTASKGCEPVSIEGEALQIPSEVPSSSSVASTPEIVMLSPPAQATEKGESPQIVSTASPSLLAAYIALAQYGDDSEDEDEGSLWNGSEGLEEGVEVVQCWAVEDVKSKERDCASLVPLEEVNGSTMSRKRRFSDVADGGEREDAVKHMRACSLEDLLGITYDSQVNYFGGESDRDMTLDSAPHVEFDHLSITPSSSTCSVLPSMPEQAPVCFGCGHIKSSTFAALCDQCNASLNQMMQAAMQGRQPTDQRDVNLLIKLQQLFF